MGTSLRAPHSNAAAKTTSHGHEFASLGNQLEAHAAGIRLGRVEEEMQHAPAEPPQHGGVALVVAEEEEEDRVDSIEDEEEAGASFVAGEPNEGGAGSESEELDAALEQRTRSELPDGEHSVRFGGGQGVAPTHEIAPEEVQCTGGTSLGFPLEQGREFESTA